MEIDVWYIRNKTAAQGKAIWQKNRRQTKPDKALYILSYLNVSVVFLKFRH
ncbi:hypothetical protein NEISUBOT_03603 [Neisseria subflava NJ9703]|uniref:Uncharacterized protein n=1 Tax=Neisseria subflava NJ9703 TaxID=546268 RepID=A0A9W5IS48_NEISU|nr:hypothetical protein NEISUBOT_03603 [Neisseria subflava NJ9703]